jgi:hypothetical protein
MKYLLTLLALFATSAFAVGIGNDNPPSGGGGDIKNTQTTVVGVSNESRANALNYVKNITNVAPAEVTTSVTTAPVSVSYNEAQQPANTRNEQVGTVNVRTVPNVFGGNVYPTAPCMGSSTVGAAALGWGASVGTSWADDGCGIRETARSFQNLNMPAEAVIVLCSSKYAAVAPVCKAVAAAAPEQK